MKRLHNLRIGYEDKSDDGDARAQGSEGADGNVHGFGQCHLDHGKEWDIVRGSRTRYGEALIRGLTAWRKRGQL